MPVTFLERVQPEVSPAVVRTIAEPLRAGNVVVGFPRDREVRSTGEPGLRPLGDEHEALSRDLNRYSECLNAMNVECLSELTFNYTWTDEDRQTHPALRLPPTMLFTSPAPVVFNLSGEPGFVPVTSTMPAVIAFQEGPSSLLQLSRSFIEDALESGLISFGYWQMEVSDPFAIEGTDPNQFAVAQYDLTRYQGSWNEMRGYLIGISEDSGKTWRFIDETTAVNVGIERIIPGYDGSTLPSIIDISFPQQFRRTSRYLETTTGGFYIRGDGSEASYDLAFDVKKKIKNDTCVILVFENPDDPTHPYVIRSWVARKQKEIKITSPLITGFEPYKTYSVAVFGYRAGGDQILFEHHQPLFYHPVADRDVEYVTGLAEAVRMLPPSSSLTINPPGISTGRFP